jgi:hypothetical protein
MKNIERYTIRLSKSTQQDMMCFSAGFSNLGTSTVLLDNSIPIPAGGQYVFPVVGSDCIYDYPVEIKFTGEGTNDLLITLIKPGNNVVV